MAAASTFDMTITEKALRLKAEDISCIREDKYLFKPISFSLKPSDVLHIKGSNGIGKTTLLRSLCGLGTPFEGNLKVNGVRFQNLREADLAFQLVDLKGGLHPALTVQDHLDLFKKLYGTSDSIDPVLARYLKTPVSRLSSGLRQELALQSLGFEKPLWLLDEPFVSLDEKLTQRLRNRLQQYQDQGGILIIVSHGTQHEPAYAQKITLEAA